MTPSPRKKAERIQIGKYSYLASSPKITLVVRADGSEQWMLKKSRFVTMAYRPNSSSRSYCHINDVIMDHDAQVPVFHTPTDDYVRVSFQPLQSAMPNDIWTRKNNVTSVDGTTYHITDWRIVRRFTAPMRAFALRSQCLKLSGLLYPDDKYELASLCVQTPEGAALSKDCAPIAVPTSKGSIEKTYKHINTIRLAIGSIGVVLTEKGQLNEFIKLVSTHSEPKRVYLSSTIPMVLHDTLPNLLASVSKGNGVFFDKAIDSFHVFAFGDAVADTTKIKRMSVVQGLLGSEQRRKFLGFPDELCNHAISIDASEARKLLPGGSVRQDHRVKLVKSDSNKLLGLPYTYGVEFECALGYLDDTDIQDCHLAEVGDRSIGANEYVTGVLHGDSGVGNIAKVCSALQRKTFVDSRCGLHVHVGGFEHSEKFSVAAIKLGTLIEESIFMTQPQCRTPLTKQTASICTRSADGRWGGDFTKISDTSYERLLSQFVFNDNVPHEMWSGIDQGKWPPARYKWLNLCNLHGKSRFRTIEFRVFAGTHDLWSILQYIRMSMAFVWTVENKRDLVMKSSKLSISDVAAAAYQDMPHIKNQLLRFIEIRSSKFKRELYQITKSE